MKYNEKYDLFVDDDLVIYRWDKNLDKLVQVKPFKNPKGYLLLRTKNGMRRAHRVIWETFVGEIPEGFEIDHINTIKTDNRLENLQIVTHKENMNNPLTIKHNSEAQRGNTNSRGKIHSDFGGKILEHYGSSRTDNYKLYHKELTWYLRHNKKCRWED